MEIDKIDVIDLETHDTKDTKDGHINGNLTVIWRDWDKIIPKEPKMMYITSAHPGEIKGPHLHKKRNSYFLCIKGKMIFIIKEKNGEYREIQIDEKNPRLIQVPKNFPSAHINIGNEEAKILTIADIAWMPNDDEMENVFFEDYDWDKLKNNI